MHVSECTDLGEVLAAKSHLITTRLRVLALSLSMSEKSCITAMILGRTVRAISNGSRKRQFTIETAQIATLVAVLERC